MSKCHKIILVVSPDSENRLDAFVERCLHEGVNFIAVVGPNCSRFEDIIDELVVGDGSDGGRDILTSSHPNESLEEVIAFANSLTDEYAGPAKVVEL